MVLCVGPDGERRPHERRLQQVTLEENAQRLLRCARELQTARDFAGLYTLIERDSGGILGVGPLAVYDVALRIGVWRREVPELVYLHWGTKAGAAVFGLRGKTIHRNELLGLFRAIHPPNVRTVFASIRISCGIVRTQHRWAVCIALSIQW
jgi:hypothetical protein